MTTIIAGRYATKLPGKCKDSLAWIADRYTSAEKLYDGSTFVRSTDGFVMFTPEHVAWEYLDELPKDNGVQGAVLPPCAGGPLATALIGLWEAII